ncbi:MAG TPA: hypothetical protein VEO95_07035 [Chthoniobacteraceae bacterium]|nr:hypothetical protein [Chthoniobacteraceae bacterium]
MKPFCSLLALAALAAACFAQTPAATPTPAGTQSAIALFRAKLPGGTYEVAVRAILAVTSHEYLVDGVARVTEVNIDTAGSLLARFYYIEPATPNSPVAIGNAAIAQTQRLLQEAADKSGQDVWKKVIKNYPTTTHARTVEYRVESMDQLNQIYASAEAAFRTQKDTRVTIGSE